MEYNFQEIENKWQQWWEANNVYKVSNDSSKPKYYVLDMFPYPSGAGLHVGHPLGYIASDIYARYKRLKGYNVLHPMGYDAFGLPAEQYAIEHGIHPAISTKQNIENFRKQLDKIGFSFDWSREVNTSNPSYYKWTQWIFLQLFKSYYDRQTKKAESIDSLVASFKKDGNKYHPVPNAQFRLSVNSEQLPVAAHSSQLTADGLQFTAEQWKSFTEKQQQDILMEYRLAYCGYGEVNWCEALGTVLANDEVVNGVSERGGYPVIKKKLRQWYLRITEYADRLLEGLETVDFSDAMKEMQTNWIGKSYGAEIDFRIDDSEKLLRVFTTRPDTIFGVDFMVIAPEHELVEEITTHKHKQEVEDYLKWVKSRSERERMAEKTINGAFTGAYAINPFDNREVPIYISEYVLAGYGTGAIMAVPCGDERDFRFAKHFNIEITNILGDAFNGKEANSTKDAELQNSNFLTGMLMKDAIKVIVREIEDLGYGKAKVNYKMRDAAFSRQRYWGEPFPIVWEDGIAYPLDENELPLELPQVENYKPGPEGEGPLANVPEWTARNLETNTMPGYAGSSWYFFRYMDPHNDATFCDKKVSDYWNQVDVYVGGTEHAVGHLLYSRMWTKFLFDLDLISFDEPYKKLLNQGMITGVSEISFRLNDGANESMYEEIKYIDSEGHLSFYLLDKLRPVYYSYDYTLNKDKYDEIRVPIEYTNNSKVDVSRLSKSNDKFLNAAFVTGSGVYYDDKFHPFESPKDKNSTVFLTKPVGEKMSKSKLNTISPYEPPVLDTNGNKIEDESGLIVQYGADTFRMYEMFLGPVEQSKPWDTKGIEGVHRFLRKFWRLFYDEQKGKVWNEEKATDVELKILHKAIKKIEEDTERFSYNTAVSAFMVCTNELADLKCSKKEILEPLVIMLSSYAPHIAEELYHALGNEGSVLDATYPTFDAKYLVESTKEYPISINGKLRTTMNISLNAGEKEVKEMVLQNAVVKRWLDGKQPKKVIFVKGKMVNVVI